MVSVPPWLLPNPIASTTGELTDAEQIVLDNTNLVGLVTGSARTQTAIERLDATGVGAAFVTFTSSFTAQTSNIDTWFNGRQLNRLRWTDDGPNLPPTFTLPGATALNTAFDALVAKGLPEVLRFLVEYTGPTSTSLRVVPRDSNPPQIQGISTIIVRSGVRAEIEITRTGGVISNYIFQSIGGIGDTSGGTLDAVKLINPREAVFDASANGPLPSVAVVEGNAYTVVNAPADGSGRFNQRMRNGDRVVWTGATFTSWSATPAQWFVLSLTDVVRGTQIDEEFLSYTEVSPRSDRNTVTRGALLSDTAGEIRLKLYATRGDYSAADLNTTGDIDEYTDPASQTAFLAIRLSGNQAANADDLPNLYVYEEDGSGNFVRLLNLDDDFTHQGDFGAESDYLSLVPIDYVANDTLRIYFGSVVDHYFNRELDINEENLSPSVQAKLNRTDGNGTVDEQRLSTLESKMNALYPLTPDVDDLTAFSAVFDPARSVSGVVITTGYSLIADYRGDAQRYESAGVTYDASGTNVVRYTGLTADLRRVFGFRVSGPADQVLMWVVDGSELIPYVDITAAGAIRINNYTPSTTEDQSVVALPVLMTRTGGTAVITRANNSVSTWTVNDFPANATQTERSLQVGVRVYLNGSDTQAEHLEDIVATDVPQTLTAQPRRQFTASVYLGPLYNNRTVTVTIGFEFRVSGSDLLVDFTLLNAPSDVTIEPRDVYVLQTYTAPAAVARVDNFQAFEDEGGVYTFSGINEFILSFQPIANTNIQDAVLVGTTAAGVETQFNDIAVIEPEAGFASVEVPDAAAVSGFEFRTFLPDHFFIHSRLAALLSRRTTQWAYGLARLDSVTELAITETIDFSNDIVLTSPDSSRWQISISNAGVISGTKLP